MKICLLIIDMQSVYLQENPVEKKYIDSACMYINFVSGLLRSKDHLVMHIQDVEGIQETNKEAYEIIPEIKIENSDLRLKKVHSNAFWNTELEQTLKDNNVELVIISGFAAEHCVLFTYNGARERGFNTVILQNGILSTKSDVITSTYRDRNLISYPAIQYMINK